MNNEQRQLSYRMLVFAEVLKRGSFTAAAAALGLNKSAVSTYISQLEEHLDVRLLNRSTRKLNATPAGERFGQHCFNLKSTMKLALDEVKSMKDIPSGNVSLTAPHAFEDTIIAPVVAQLCKDYPDLVPKIIFSDERLDLLEHKLDLAITVGALPDSNYHAINLGTMNSILVASPKLLENMSDLNIEDLNKIRHVRPTWQANFELKNINTGVEVLIEDKNRIEVNTLSGTLALVTTGAGIALVPKLLVRRQLLNGELQQAFAQWQGLARPIYAVHSYQQQLPYLLRHITEQLKQQILNYET